MTLQKRTYSSKKKAKKSPSGSLTLAEAMAVIRALEVGKHHVHSYELHIKCKLDKGAIPIRGSVLLPTPLIKSTSILVFASGPLVNEAKNAGASLVGGEELIDDIAKGHQKLDKFDKAFSTVDIYPSVKSIARTLGPKGLMPMEKRGTVTNDLVKAIKDSIGKFEFKADKQGVIHTGNILALLQEIRDIYKLGNYKGKTIEEVVLNSTRGPGIPLNNVLTMLDKLEEERNLLEMPVTGGNYSRNNPLPTSAPPGYSGGGSRTRISGTAASSSFDNRYPGIGLGGKLHYNNNNKNMVLEI
ncbi:11018_t:CDS:2 [Ambispora gerdemannii]|uniref:11018_t:CDS:1 n=1 Tax=Ambispora gerdemannii TaxID=144530 RepID=A0A9N9CSF2_9GLOM|nr:11018_t:CDS:2 [Ambispora gerdemannii]